MTDATTNEAPCDVPRSPRNGRLRSDDQWESTRGALHEMLMAGCTLGSIAKVFGRSEQTIRRWRDRMYGEMRAEAKHMEPRDHALEVLDRLHTSVSAAWLNFRGAETSKEKTAALSLHLKAVEQLHQFNQSVGLYGQRGSQPMHPAASGGDYDDEDSGVSLIARMAKDFLSALAGERDHSGRPAGVSDGGILWREGDDGARLSGGRKPPEAENAAASVVHSRMTDAGAMGPSADNLNMQVRKRKRLGADEHPKPRADAR